MNRAALTELEQRLSALLPTTGNCERTIWLCGQLHTQRAASYLDKAEQTELPGAASLAETWAEREAAAASGYVHSLELLRMH